MNTDYNVFIELKLNGFLINDEVVEQPIGTERHIILERLLNNVLEQLGEDDYYVAVVARKED